MLSHKNCYSKQSIETYLTESVDRREFLPDDIKHLSGVDCALPVGYGQTISQPSLVLLMTYLLNPQMDSKVLEIGTGTGYQSAILSLLCKDVYSVERIPQLYESASERLDRLGYSNVHLALADGSNGWAEKAPFDRIIVTAAAGRMPITLLDQLSLGGSMIVPVGPTSVQDLILIEKRMDGSIKEKTIEKVRFVEFVGKYGW